MIIFYILATIPFLGVNLVPERYKDFYMAMAGFIAVIVLFIWGLFGLIGEL